MIGERSQAPPHLGTFEIIALGSFNTLLLVLLAAVAALARGGSIGFPQGMHPAFAIVVLLALWLLTCWTTARAVRGHQRTPIDSWGSTWARGIQHGIKAGAIAIAALFLLLIVRIILDDRFTGETATAVSYTMLYVWTLGLIAALVIGGAAGFIVSTVDRVVLRSLRRA